MKKSVNTTMIQLATILSISSIMITHHIQSMEKTKEKPSIMSSFYTNDVSITNKDSKNGIQFNCNTVMYCSCSNSRYLSGLGGFVLNGPNCHIVRNSFINKEPAGSAILRLHDPNSKEKNLSIFVHDFDHVTIHLQKDKKTRITIKNNILEHPKKEVAYFSYQ